MSVRAKFRCKSQGRDWDLLSEVCLLPVYDDGNEDNKAFWEATPSGSAQLQYWGDVGMEQFEIGSYYYIDFTKVDAKAEGPARYLHTVNDRGDGHIEVKLKSGWRNKDTSADVLREGTITMAIDNPSGATHFIGEVLSRWLITFTFAHKAEEPEA